MPDQTQLRKQEVEEEGAEEDPAAEDKEFDPDDFMAEMPGGPGIGAGEEDAMGQTRKSVKLKKKKKKKKKKLGETGRTEYEATDAFGTINEGKAIYHQPFGGEAPSEVPQQHDLFLEGGSEDSEDEAAVTMNIGKRRKKKGGTRRKSLSRRNSIASNGGSGL